MKATATQNKSPSGNTYNVSFSELAGGQCLVLMTALALVGSYDPACGEMYDALVREWEARGIMPRDLT